MLTSRKLQGLSALLLLATSLILGFPGCGSEPDKLNQPNVLLISIDTLRADHLGCYGYHLPTTPEINAFAKDSVLFGAAMAQAPSTLPSHASILTSLIPYHHSAFLRLEAPLPAPAVTLTELLLADGYQTAAFTGGGQLDPVWGLNQGFETYRALQGATFREVTEAALGWIDHKYEGRFFLFLHTYEVHHPYTPEKSRLEIFEHRYSGPLPDAILIDHLRRINRGELMLEEQDLDHIKHTYDAEIHSMDEGFGYLLDELRRRHLYDDTLIVFTSDHGEEFGEHGAVGWHSHTLYQELLHVPLIIKFPGYKHSGTEVPSVVRSIDIAPTITTSLGISPPTTFDGINLQRLLTRSSPPDLPAFGMIEPKHKAELERMTFRSSLRRGPWKIYNGFLFDLQSNPQETKDKSNVRSLLFEELQAEKMRIISTRTPLRARRANISDETARQLRALGYLR